jgi:hypothetical protein
MKFKEVAKDIFLLDFKTQNKLTSTFLRFQEHFESPKFRNKIFTLEQYKKWYVKNSPRGKKLGKFTYYSDWGGFNIPSYILEPFYEGKFDPLTKAEKMVLNLFENKRGANFYVIGTFANKKEVLKHELAHGLFYTNPKYKKQVQNVLHKLDQSLRKQLNRYLGSLGGYHKSVFEDETHANILTNLDSLDKKGIVSPEVKEASKRLEKIFKKYKES